MRCRIPVRASMLLAALSAMAASASAQRVQMPVGYRLTWIGARWQADAKVIDPGTGRPTNAPLTYRIADPAVATVSARGEVTARKPGNTRLWAISGRDSASALIVVEQWPARFTFSPATVYLDAVDARQPIRVLASDSAGVPIAGATARAGACRSLNERVAKLTDETVVAVASGSTWIRCSDRGIADSIRVEVQQRPRTVVINNKGALLRQRVPGDTFSVVVVARDRNSREVRDARPTWASLNPLVVSVDPVTGRARAVGGGDTRVIAQVGDVADSVAISVSGAPAQPLVTVQASDTAVRSKAALLVQEVFVYEGETTFVSLTALDSAGISIPVSSITFRLVDTTVAAQVDSARIVGRQSGQTQLIARYGSLADTSFVNVRQRQAGGGASAEAIDAARAAFKPYEVPDSTAQHQQALQEVRRSITTDPTVQARRQNLVLTTNAFGSFAEHFVRTEAGATEDRTGPMYGGAASLLLYEKIELLGSLRLGTLTSVDTIGEDLDAVEFEGSAGLFPIRQLGLRAGMILRGESSPIARQTWMIPKVSLVSRFNFIGDVFSTYAAFSLLPKASSRRSADIVERGSLFSRGGEAGLEFRLPGAAGLNGGLTYYVEQISFDESDRIEGFSAIRLRFGFNVGR